MEIRGFTLPHLRPDNTCQIGLIASGDASAIARAYPDPEFKEYVVPYLKCHCQGKPLSIVELGAWEALHVKGGEVWFKILVIFKYEG